MVIRPTLESYGLELADVGAARRAETVRIEANGETRVDWLLRVDRPSEAKIKVTAREEGGDRRADAMEKTFSVHDHGIEKLVATAGKMRGDRKPHLGFGWKVGNKPLIRHGMVTQLSNCTIPRERHADRRASSNDTFAAKP